MTVTTRTFCRLLEHYGSIKTGQWRRCFNALVIVSVQWRRNEFESGDTDPVVPLRFLALKAQLVVLLSALVMVSTVPVLLLAVPPC